MFCVYCGTKVPDGTRFCTACGKPMKSKTEPAAGGGQQLRSTVHREKREAASFSPAGAMATPLKPVAAAKPVYSKSLETDYSVPLSAPAAPINAYDPNMPVSEPSHRVPEDGAYDAVSYHTAAPLPESCFDGGVLGLIGVNFVVAFLSVITLGIAYPWLCCYKLRWIYRHTCINGYRLKFDGRGGQLLGNWLLWSLLTIITLGIYSLWLPIKLKKWETKHVSIASADFR